MKLTRFPTELLSLDAVPIPFTVHQTPNGGAFTLTIPTLSPLLLLRHDLASPPHTKMRIKYLSFDFVLNSFFTLSRILKLPRR